MKQSRFSAPRESRLRPDSPEPRRVGEAGGIRGKGCGAVSPVRRGRGDLLPLEVKVRWDEVSEARRLKVLEDENRRLKQPAAAARERVGHTGVEGGPPQADQKSTDASSETGGCGRHDGSWS